MSDPEASKRQLEADSQTAWLTVPSVATGSKDAKTPLEVLAMAKAQEIMHIAHLNPEHNRLGQSLTIQEIMTFLEHTPHEGFSTWLLADRYNGRHVVRNQMFKEMDADGSHTIEAAELVVAVQKWMAIGSPGAPDILSGGDDAEPQDPRPSAAVHGVRATSTNHPPQPPPQNATYGIKYGKYPSYWPTGGRAAALGKQPATWTHIPRNVLRSDGHDLTHLTPRPPHMARPPPKQSVTKSRAARRALETDTRDVQFRKGASEAAYLTAQREQQMLAGMDARRKHGPGPARAFKRLSVFLCKSVLYGAFVWARRAPNRRKWRFPARAEMVEREKKALAHTSLPALLQAADKVGVPVAEVDIALTDAAPKIALMRGPGPPAGAVKRLSVAHSKSSLYGAFVWAHRALNAEK